jgi:hypothetical protein
LKNKYFFINYSKIAKTKKDKIKLAKKSFIVYISSVVDKRSLTNKANANCKLKLNLTQMRKIVNQKKRNLQMQMQKKRVSEK